MRVGEGQFGRLEDNALVGVVGVGRGIGAGGLVGEDVDVDDTIVVDGTLLDVVMVGFFGVGGFAQFTLDGLRGVEQIYRSELGFERNADIAKFVLGLKSPWLRIKKRGASKDGPHTGVEQTDSLVNCLPAIAKIRS